MYTLILFIGLLMKAYGLGTFFVLWILHLIIND